MIKTIERKHILKERRAKIYFKKFEIILTPPDCSSESGTCNIVIATRQHYIHSLLILKLNSD